MKKKAIKIATASVVAASSFAAVAPFSTEAASSVPSTVAKAVKSMKAAKTAYKSLGDKGKVASVASVQKAVNQAKADYSKAKAALAKYKGKDKSKLNKQLMAAMKDYHNATDYIKAVNYASGLKKQADSFAAAAKAGKSINVSDYAKFKAELAKATKKVMDQIVGLADKAVVKAYITPALSAAKTVDSYLVSIKSVDEVAAVTVDEGSKLEDVNLPKEVTVTLVNGKKAQKAVTWDTKELEANLSKPGEYTVKGAVAGTKLEASVKVTVKEVAPAIVSTKAIAANTIEVTFNKAVDTEKAKVELLRGTFKQNATVKWADDNKSVQLVGAGNFLAGDYTVNVTGLGEEALTGSVKVEAQKVSSIQILSDVAVLSSNPNGTITDQTATVGYVVKDQYGTDITKTTDLTTNDSTNVTIPTKGTVQLKGLSGKRIGDVVPVVLVHAQSGTTASATVKLSAASTVADISVDGVYNAKGEKVELTDNTKASDVFLVLNLKDQYGNAIEPANASSEAAGVIVTNTNPLVAKLVNDKVTTATINGKNKFVVKFTNLNDSSEFKGGSAELLFIQTMDGKTFKHTINVAETKATDAVSLGQPQFAIAGEDVKLPITVLDKEGNVITDKDLLAHATKGIKVNGDPAVKSNFEVKDGQVYYNLGQPKVSANSYATATVTTSTNKVATVTYKVNEAAKPVAVRGLKNPLILKATKSKAIDFAAVNVEDQYGRIMTKLPEGYGVAVENISADSNQAVTVTDNQIVVAGSKNGTATITIYLTDKDGKVANSAVQQQVRVTDGKEYSDYQLAEIGKVKVGAPKEFTVNGILGSGKVALDPSEYTAEVIGAVTATATDGKITVTKLDSKDEVTEKELTLKVTINATGKVIEQKFVASKADNTVQDFFFTTAIAGSEYEKAEAITDVIVKDGTFTIASPIDVDGKPTTLNVATVDQYGNEAVATIASPVVTIVPEKAADVTITGNGTTAAKAVLVSDVKETKLTVKVKIGNATKELKVTLQSAASK